MPSMNPDAPGAQTMGGEKQGEGGAGGASGRSPDEIALELMKFVAVTTGYGRSGGSSTGFSGKPANKSAEEYAESLLQLFERCREVVKKGK